jgi:hypothetical protein
VHVQVVSLPCEASKKRRETEKNRERESKRKEWSLKDRMTNAERRCIKSLRRGREIRRVGRSEAKRETGISAI